MSSPFQPAIPSIFVNFTEDPTPQLFHAVLYYYVTKSTTTIVYLTFLQWTTYIALYHIISIQQIGIVRKATYYVYPFLLFYSHTVKKSQLIILTSSSSSSQSASPFSSQKIWSINTTTALLFSSQIIKTGEAASSQMHTHT